MRYILFLMFMVLASCANDELTVTRLDSIDSIVDVNPQAAYDSLCALGRGNNARWTKAAKMKWRMLDAKVRNRLYMPLPSDSTFSDVVSYFDSHGSDNEKMQSHYLLGCIYRDMNDAPKAIECFQEAVCSADTTTKDCDYKSMSRIYGQMGDIYCLQFLTENAKKAFQRSEYFAFKAGDIKNSIIALESQIELYCMEGDTLSAINIVNRCNKLYRKYGFYKLAAGVYSTLIYVYLERGQYSKAKEYMDVYERDTRFFDETEYRHQHFFKAKGMYYIGVGKLDSAEYCFRKLLLYNSTYEATQGLLSVYSRKNIKDSISKYAEVCEHEMDKILQETQANATMQATALFNYSRIQNEAKENEHRAERTKFFFFFAVVLLIILYVYSYLRNKLKLEKNMRELALRGMKYQQVCKDLSATKQDLEKLKTGYIPSLDSYKKKIADLEEEKDALLAFQKNMDVSASLSSLKSCDIYKLFKKKSSTILNNVQPTETEWNTLEEQINYLFPNLLMRIKNNNTLSWQEQKISILVSIGFTSSDIQILLDTSSQVVSNAKRSINKKLFDVDSARSLGKNLRDLLY